MNRLVRYLDGLDGHAIRWWALAVLVAEWVGILMVLRGLGAW